MRLCRDLSIIPLQYRHCVVALGNFDGLHLGHQAVIDAALDLAKEYNAPSAVLTFFPHPREFFQPALAPLRIYRLRTKITLLRALGIDALFLQRFDAAFAALPPEAFIEQILKRRLHACHVVTGEHFVFGKARAGTAALLHETAKQHGFGYTSVPTYADANGIACSSSRIRTLLKEGAVAQASMLLGRPYAICGRVVQGDNRGRLLGFPTANIRFCNYFSPAYGVYAVRVQLPGGGKLNGVANFGIRPTFTIPAPLLEVHCFDYHGDLYGKRLEVELVRHIRPERRFEGVEALKRQIKEDCAVAGSILNLHSTL